MLKRVRITFSVHGIVGGETYEVSTPGPEYLEARAFGRLEEELIAAGMPTWECGCCVVPDGIEVISTEVMEAS